MQKFKECRKYWNISGLALLLLTLFGVIACNHGDAPLGNDSNAVVPLDNSGANAVGDVSVDVQLIASQLDVPLQVTHSSSTDARVFIVTRAGLIYLYEENQLLSTPFLDISDWVTNGGEQGLLGMAFDPNYEQNGVFYVNYTGIKPDGSGNADDTRIVAMSRDLNDPNQANKSNHFLLLSIAQPELNHNGGQLLFGLDGYLYIGTGDGGGGGDQHGVMGNGQDLTTLLGKMLRIQTHGLAPYTVPEDNPFLHDPNARDEIWAYGLRNPFRFSFDRTTGDLYIADVGQNQMEEINHEAASSVGGLNYGWRLKEGSQCFQPQMNCDNGGLTDPIYEYSHENGNCSVTGGFVYRGSSLAPLQGRYLFADFCTGQFSTLQQISGNWQVNGLQVFLDGTALSARVTGFGEDHKGEMYFTTTDSVYRLNNLR